jgi:hypothetical protein
MSLISPLLLLTAALGTVDEAGAAPVVAVAGTSGLAVAAALVVVAGVAPGSGNAAEATPPAPGFVWLFPCGFEYGTMLFVAI